ncbi:unnamed protein product [Rhodiola kirilowii]
MEASAVAANRRRMRGSRNPAQIPAFGNWDYVQDQVPITQYFECCARPRSANPRAFVYPYAAYPRSGYVDDEFHKSIFDAGDDFYDADRQRRSQRRVCSSTEKTTARVSRQQAKVYDLSLSETIRTERSFEQNDGVIIPDPYDVAWIEKVDNSENNEMTKNKNVKAKDEDLYKIPPELLRKSKRVKEDEEIFHQMSRDNLCILVNRREKWRLPGTYYHHCVADGFVVVLVRLPTQALMAVPVEEAIAALSTFSLEDEQPEVQGPAVWVSTERGATISPVEYSDVSAYRLSLSEDTKALNLLNTLILEGKEMASVLYTYRSCVKALPQLPDSKKQSQADLYMETYQVLDLEMSRLREIQRWQASAASKLAADMQRFSRPERRINGPTVTHLWSMLKLLDVLVQLDHLKNAKASIPNDFSWYKRTFTQVSVQWQDTDTMREELDDLQIFLSNRWAILLNLQVDMFRTNNVEDILQVLIVFVVESLELDFTLLFTERHTLLRVLPVLIRHYLISNYIGSIRVEHDEFVVRFSSAMNQLLLMKATDGSDVEWCKEVKGSIYDMVVEGFQLLSKWTGRIWEQCAWKFSRPCKEESPTDLQDSSGISDYEKVVRYNYSSEERKVLVELISYIKSVGSMMQKCDTVVADALWETIHSEVQDFVQNTLAIMLRTTFKKKKDVSRLLSDMRTLSADWMANTSKPESDFQSSQHGSEENRGNIFYPRPVAPTSAQVHCLQFLIYEVVSGGNLRKPGGLFGNSGSEIPANDLKILETFFYKLSFFLHIIDYTATLETLTDLGFLWYREFYLESSRVIQFPIECSLPWMLIDHVIESQNAGLVESVLIPFDIYNDAAQQALVVLKQRFLYDEIEAEVDHCFDIFVSKLSETMFTYYKSWAATELLDPSFLFALDNGEKYAFQPRRFTTLLKMTRVKLLGRTIDLRSLIAGHINKMFRDNIEYLFDRFESQDLCAIVELEKLINIMKLTHELLSKDLLIDSFDLMMNEMQENVSLVSFSSRLATQFWTEMQNDFLPNFILCNTTQRFVRSSKVSSVPVQKPTVPYAKPNFYCGTPDLNSAHQSFARLHSGFFGVPHMISAVRLLGSRSLPWLIRALLDHISNKVTMLEPMITDLQEALPKSIGLLPFDGGVTGCTRLVKEQLNWGSKSEIKLEVLRGIKEIGSVIYWMGLLDIVLRQADTVNFMQTAPWLGLVPSVDGQILQSQDNGESPIVNLFKSAATAIVSAPGCVSATSFHTLSKQAEAADLLYRANMNTGSVLEYALAFTSAALDKYCSKWSVAPKTGFIDITTTKDFYRIFSGLQMAYLEESVQTPSNNHELLGDSIAWGGCTIIYLLGQQLHFELFDFSYQVLNIAEVEGFNLNKVHTKSQHVQGSELLLEAMKKARRLNNHVFSMLKARCPLEDKTACAIKLSGAPNHKVIFENTVSAFETLPQKSAYPCVFVSHVDERKEHAVVSRVMSSHSY